MVSSSKLADASASVPFSPAFSRPEKRGVISKVAPIGAKERAAWTAGLARRVHGVFASVKNGMSIPWMTVEQRDLMVLLEVDASVVSYEPSPERVSLILDGRPQDHVPDFRLKTRRGVVVIDAFRASSMQSRERLVQALADLYADRGVAYRGLSAADIRLEPRFRNATWVRAHGARQPSMADELHLVGWLSTYGARTFDRLRVELPAFEAVASACSMALRNELALDLSAKEPDGIIARLAAGGSR